MSRLFGGDEPPVEFVADSLIAGVFFGGVGAGAAFPTLPTLGPITDIAPFVVGLILPTNWSTRLAVNTPAGQIFDRMRARQPMIAGLAVQGLSPFGYILRLNPGPTPLDNATVFPLSRACWGVGSVFVFVGAFSTITHVTSGGNRGKWVGYMCGGQSLGFPVGLVAGGLVTGAFSYAATSAVAGCAGLLAVLVAISILPDARTDVTVADSLREVPRPIGADIHIFTAGTVNLAARFLLSGVFLSAAVLYATVNNTSFGGLSGAGASGVVTAVGVAASSVTTPVVGWYSDRLSNCAALTLLTPGILAVGSTLLVLASTLPSTFAGVALISINVGGSNPPLLAYLGDLSPADDMGRLGGVYNVFGDSGSTLGPLMAVPLAEVVGFRVEYLVCVAPVVVVGLLVARMLYGGVVTVPGPELSRKVASGAGRTALFEPGAEVV